MAVGRVLGYDVWKFRHMIHEPGFLRMAVELSKIIQELYIRWVLKGSNYGIAQDTFMTGFIIYILY